MLSSEMTLRRKSHQAKVKAGEAFSIKARFRGKGMNFVKNKFQEMDDAKKLEYKQKEAELKEKYDEELKSYKEGETYKEIGVQRVIKE